MAATLSDRVLSGEVGAMARAISLIEDESPAAAALVGAIFPHTGRAFLVGITGPPGAGKSTLVDALVADARRRGETVGVLAIDPTSPFTGGAILGDRLRMQAHAADPDVFIRSMATRGHLGGLARATSDAALVLDAAGKSLVIIETVGVGQDEIDIVRTADVSIVVLVPGTGDDVQALKAGLMEIADVFVVNKADREGADRLVSVVQATLALQPAGKDAWHPPVLKTEAHTATGIEALWDAIARFRAQPAERRTRRLEERHDARLRDLVTAGVRRRLERDVLQPGEWDAVVARIASRDVDPYTAAAALVDRVCGTVPEGGAAGLGQRRGTTS